MIFLSTQGYVVLSMDAKDVLWMEVCHEKIHLLWTTKKSNNIILFKMETSEYISLSIPQSYVCLDLSSLRWMRPLFYSLNGKEYLEEKDTSMNTVYDMVHMKCFQKKEGHVSDLPPWSIFIPTFDQAFNAVYPGLEHLSTLEKYVWRVQNTQPLKWIEYLHFKYRKEIESLEYPSFQYDKKNTFSLLFVDDRYNPVFPLLLRLFMFSLPHAECNFHIFCMEEDKENYERACVECRMYGTVFHLLDKPIGNQESYSKLLSKHSFWSEIKEEHVLLFQYDSFVFDKMELSFFKKLKRELYVGACWPYGFFHNKKWIYVGNGGTSFRNARVMEIICKRFSNPTAIAEDVFFAKMLAQLDYNLCSREIGEKFSSELTYHNECLYGHQIYHCIPLSNIERVWRERFFDKWTRPPIIKR